MKDWVKTAVVYQIYPRSFLDTNGDGVGDLPGIISKLDYLRGLGVNVLWLSPVYRSPNVDNGYDISDYTDINPEYGTMDDMKTLLAEAKARDMRVIMDLVINHTSKEHKWFSENPDYYFFREGKDGGKKPPNNWTGFFGGGTWEKDGESGKYYLHLFHKDMPDLDFDNERVVGEIMDVMRYWLDMGVDGFRCDVINVIGKRSLDDGRKRLILTGREHYLSTEKCHALLRRFNEEVFGQYDCFTVGETVFVTPKTANDLCAPERGELDMVFSFAHMETDQINNKWFKTKFKPYKLFNALTKWQREVNWNANYLENHDQPRSVSRFGDAYKYRYHSASSLATLLFALRGTPFIYMGQEIGMTNGDFSGMDDIRDCESINIEALAKGLKLPGKLRWKLIKTASRDNARTPFQWDDTPNAGFTEGTPWLKVNGNYERLNAESDAAAEDSLIDYYRRLIELRKTEAALADGGFERVPSAQDVMVFKRAVDGEVILAACSLSKQKRALFAPISGEVLISNYRRETADALLTLRPYEALMLKVKEGAASAH